MKPLVIALLLFTALPLFGQEYKLQALRLSDEKEKPANAIQQSTKPIVTTYATGHWKWVDEKEEAESIGFSVSELSCDKPGLYSKDGGCNEETATVIPTVGFQVIPDHTEYEIVSWRQDGMTARRIGGTCRISYTIDIDFKTGSVLRTQAPTSRPKSRAT